MRGQMCAWRKGVFLWWGGIRGLSCRVSAVLALAALGLQPATAQFSCSVNAKVQPNLRGCPEFS